MPAPTPINIRYGDPRGMGQAAAAAGTGAFNLSQNRINAEAYERRRASDQDMIARILAAKAEERARNNELAFRYDALNAQAAMPPQMASGTALQSAARSGAQKTATMTTAAGQATMPLLVPVPGSRPEGTMEMQGRGGNAGERYFKEGGSIRKEISDPSTGRVFLDQEAGRINPSSAIPGNLPASTQQRLSAVAAMQGSIPTDDFNRLWVAAQSEGYTTAQLMDDIVAAKAKVGKSPIEQSTIDAAGRSEFQMKAIETLPPDTRIASMRDFLHMADEDLYDDAAIQRAWNARRARNNAVMGQPIVQNSGGRSPTGGNPVPVTSPEEALSLPSGTYIQLPDGTTGRVP